jgi:hypothetical protein
VGQLERSVLTNGPTLDIYINTRRVRRTFEELGEAKLAEVRKLEWAGRIRDKHVP